MIGILGCAHIHTNDYINLLKSRENIKVTAVWDSIEERAYKFCEKISCDKVNKPEEIYNNQEITAVIICSETDLHDELVIKSFNANKSIFVEKPLAINYDRTKNILSKIDLSNCIFQIGFFLRANKVIKRLRELIAEGVLGLITQVHVEFCHSGILDNWFSEYEWMLNTNQGGFGDLSIHLIDILIWLFGDIEQVTAITSNDEIKNIYNSYGQALLKFKTGCIASIATGWAQRGEMFSMIMRGTKGYATLCNKELKVIAKHKGKEFEESYLFEPKAEDSLDAFLNTINNKATNKLLITKNEIMESSLIMKSIYESIKKRGWVKIVN